MTTLDGSIRQAIEADLARSQLSERKLGAFAVGNPALIPQIKAGGSMRLDTADQLLSYMNEAPIGPPFRSEVEAFLSETGIGERRFGAKAAGEGRHVRLVLERDGIAARPCDFPVLVGLLAGRRAGRRMGTRPGQVPAGSVHGPPPDSSASRSTSACAIRTL